MSKIPLAVQLYSLREMFPEQPLTTLRMVKDAGYTGVEFWGSHFKNSFYAALLEETGLVCAGWHTGIDALEGDAFETTVQKSLAVGNKYIVVPWFKADSADGWKKFADRLNLISGKLRPYGIRVGFHCHAHEFVPVDGELPWDIVAQNTDRRVVLQLDSGNAASAGVDPAEILCKYPFRNQTVHWKAWSAENGFRTSVGADAQDWQKMLAWSEDQGETEWIIVEYEEEDPLSMIRKSAEFIKQL